MVPYAFQRERAALRTGVPITPYRKLGRGFPVGSIVMFDHNQPRREETNPSRHLGDNVWEEITQSGTHRHVANSIFRIALTNVVLAGTR